MRKKCSVKYYREMAGKEANIVSEWTPYIYCTLLIETKIKAFYRVVLSGCQSINEFCFEGKVTTYDFKRKHALNPGLGVTTL